MALPIFYSAEITGQENLHVLNEETSKHMVQVLRMGKSEQLNVTNGNGYLFLASIVDDHKKGVTIQIIDQTFHTPPAKISVAISLVKNAQRFEWFLEKAVEIGVVEIFPLVCARTEKDHFRAPRMQGIIMSAMLQSQQVWLPVLHEPQKFSQFISRPKTSDAFIAHCIEAENRLSLQHYTPLKNPLILIGPEGDFTKEEIALALDGGYHPVTLGSTRLRTETAGVVAVTLLNNLTAGAQS